MWPYIGDKGHTLTHVSCASPADPAVGDEVAKSNGKAEAPPQKEGGPKKAYIYIHKY